MKKQNKLRLVRRVVQIIFLLTFLFLLANTSYSIKPPRTARLFIKLSPLISITTVIAGRAFFMMFWLSLIVLALSLFLGRYFCGWICPFGTTFDITDRIMRKMRRKTFRPQRKYHHLKYCILIIIIVTALFRVNLAGFFDPISWSARLYGLVLHPSAYFLSDYSTAKVGFYSARWLQHIIFHPQSGVGSFSQPYFLHSLSIIVLFLVLVAFGLVMRRFYCRIICPLGALFSIPGRFSFLKRYTSDKCTECSKCLRECKMGAISEKGKGTMPGECILCFNCDTVCPVDCIYWNSHRKKTENIVSSSKTVPLDFTRREIIGSILGSFAVLPVMKLAGGTMNSLSNRNIGIGATTAKVIRPPCAPPENEFLAECVKCGLCMKVCPTNGLQPLLLEQGLYSLWTPTLVPRIGYCEFTCNLCSEVCPTDALKKLSLEQKQYFALGKAEINRNKCIPWKNYSRWNKNPDEWISKYHCAVCEEHCPASDDEGKKAIQLTWSDLPEYEGKRPPLPHINTKACIGCGHCENVCPVEGDSAIRVFRTEDRGIPDWAEGLLKLKKENTR